MEADESKQRSVEAGHLFQPWPGHSDMWPGFGEKLLFFTNLGYTMSQSAVQNSLMLGQVYLAFLEAKCLLNK
jgi:hypothetical protein